MEMKIAKFELYPAETPQGYAVGFSISQNGQSMYIDTVVPLSDVSNKSPERIVRIAYRQLKTNIQAWSDSAELKSPLVGQVFTPTNEEE